MKDNEINYDEPTDEEIEAELEGLVIEGIIPCFFEDDKIKRSKSVEYKLLTEKQTKILDDIQMMLKDDELKFAKECYDQMQFIKEAEMWYYYNRGFLKAIEVLKELQIL